MRPIPLHLHSHWSLLDGVSSVREIVDFARSLELPSLALTDTNALYGAVEFTSLCREAAIRPIIGAEVALNGGHSIVLLVQNAAGYAHLCQLITLMQAAPDREAALARGLTLNDLAAHAEGLIALSGGHNGPLDAALRAGQAQHAEQLMHELANLFGRERFFIELQIITRADTAKVAALQSMVDRAGVRSVATHDIRYLSPEDVTRYRVLSAMREGKRLNDLPPLPDLSFPLDMQRKFRNFAAALDNTALVADACRFDLPLDQIHFPKLDLPEGTTPRDELWRLTREGAARHYSEATSELEARLRKEVDVIDALGYAPYFLVVADIVRYAREQRVPISPRGSASSSVVAYCLGIHDVDPIAHKLYFERFLSLERHDPPDIDLDLCSHRRDEVIDYVYRRYGADKVAMVCTYATLRPRMALRETGKVYGLSEPRIKELSKHLPWYWSMQTEATQAELMQQAQNPIEREVLQMSRALDGTPHHLSIHPGGIVISPRPITDLVPLQYATKGLLITQVDLGGIAKLGLVKIDLLGISALTVIADSIELIQQHKPDLTLESIPLQDEATSHTLSTAHSIGCFQTESPGMRVTLREVQARTIDDVIVALALFRPGPLKGGLKDAFVRRHLGHEQASYLHPVLEPILRETYGVILYQEQVLRIAHEVAGMTLGEADLLRRAMSKKSEEEMARLREQFIEGAQSISAMDAATADSVWNLMAAFAGYGFPKAHAAGYAVVAYHMAYLKTHYPAEFMTARLAVHGGFYSQRVYMAEARHLGLTLKPPHINHSAGIFTLERPHTLWMGLDQVRDLTQTTIANIIAGQPFASFEDFLTRAQPQHVEVVNLVKVGALDGLGAAKGLLAKLRHMQWRGRHSAQMGLALETILLESDELTLEERAEWEEEILGISVSVHKLQLVADELAQYELTPSDQLSAHVDQEVTLAGVQLAAHRFNDRHDEPMLLVDVEDQSGMCQVLWTGTALKEYRNVLAKRDAVLIRGRVRRDRQGITIVAGQEVWRVGDVILRRAVRGEGSGSSPAQDPSLRSG